MSELQDFRVATACSEIWQAYKEYCETSYVMRNGTIACDVLKPWATDYTYLRAECVAEHQGRAAYLLGLVLMYFPHISSKNAWFYEIMHMLSHDVGEVQYGDVLDDGSEEHEISREKEMTALDEHYDHYPEGYKDVFRALHRNFEGMSTSTETFDKLVDKAEAVLFVIFLLSKGTEGDVRMKSPRPSEQDLKYGGILGTYRTADVWCLHFRDIAKDVSSMLVSPLFEVIKQAFLDVDGRIPLCCKVNVRKGIK